METYCFNILFRQIFSQSLKTIVFPGKTVCFHVKNNLFSAEKQFVFCGKTFCFCRKNKMRTEAAVSWCWRTLATALVECFQPAAFEDKTKRNEECVLRSSRI